MINTLRQPLEYNHFSSDLTDLLNNRRQGHMIEWEYFHSDFEGDLSNGSDFWEGATRYPAYYMDTEEFDLIKYASKEISDLISPVCNITEFGPGKSLKIIPLLKSIIPSQVTGVDICKTFLADFQKHVSKNALALIDLKEADFINTPLYFQEETLIMSMGGTFFNTPMQKDGPADFETMIDILKRWKRSLTKGGYILIGQDTNNDPATLNAAYNQPYIKAMSESIWHRASRELDILNFNPKGIEYRGDWDGKNKVFKHMAMPTFDQTIYLDGARFELKKGHGYCQSNSFKLGVNDMHDMISSAGMRLIKTWKSPQNRMALHLMRV